MRVKLIVKSETAAKHAYALGETAVAPATPVIGQTQQERDGVVSATIDPRGAYRILTYNPAYPVTADDTNIYIDAFTGVLDDGRSVSFASHTESSLTSSAFYSVFYDLIDEDYVIVTAPGSTEMASRRYVFVAAQATSASGTFPTGPTPPDGGTYDPNYQEP
jgi:hypothetical protein